MLTLYHPDGNQPEDFHLSRRGLAALIFGGYAAAALSADADPIQTDEAGLVTELVQLPVSGGTIRGYVARPTHYRCSSRCIPLGGRLRSDIFAFHSRTEKAAPFTRLQLSRRARPTAVGRMSV